MRAFKFTYHYNGRASSENIKALTKVQAVKVFFTSTPNISKITNLEIYKI